MKRYLCMLVLLAVLISCFPVITSASTVENSILYLDDGSYITITLHTIDARAAGTKSGTKIYEYRANDSSLQWQAVLSGKFTYTGTSATCTSSNCAVTVVNSSWYEISETATKSGSSAFANIVMGHRVLGIKVDEHTANLTLTCDANGNLS